MRIDTRNTALISSLCVVLGLILGVLLGSSFLPRPSEKPWLETYQGLVGAFVGVLGAGIGLFVATYNVLRQMRINLLSREEDRIDKEVVGLLEAADLLSEMREAVAGHRPKLGQKLASSETNVEKQILSSKGFGNPATVKSDVIEKLERTPVPIARTTASLVHAILVAALLLERPREERDQFLRGSRGGVTTFYNSSWTDEGTRQALEEAEGYLAAVLQEAELTELSFRTRAATLQSRALGFRRELERYFS